MKVFGVSNLGCEVLFVLFVLFGVVLRAVDSSSCFNNLGKLRIRSVKMTDASGGWVGSGISNIHQYFPPESFLSRSAKRKSLSVLLAVFSDKSAGGNLILQSDTVCPFSRGLVMSWADGELTETL